MKQSHGKFTLKDIPKHIYMLFVLGLLLMLTPIPEAVFKNLPKFFDVVEARVGKALADIAGMEPQEKTETRQDGDDRNNGEDSDANVGTDTAAVHDNATTGLASAKQPGSGQYLADKVSLTNDVNILSQMLLLGGWAHKDSELPHPCAASARTSELLNEWCNGKFRSSNLRDKAIACYLKEQGYVESCCAADVKSAKLKPVIEFAVAQILSRMRKAGVLGTSEDSPMRVPETVYDAIVDFDHPDNAKDQAATAETVCREFEPVLNDSWPNLYAVANRRGTTTVSVRRI